MLTITEIYQFTTYHPPSPHMFLHSYSIANAELKKKSAGWREICGNEKRNKHSIQLTDESGGRMCAGGEKKCNKFRSCTVTVKCNEG